MNMSKTLVAYFSASGVTKELAKKLAEAAEADIFEIKPVVPYTSEDLNWHDEESRSSVEMRDPSSRPAIAEKKENMEEYDTVFVGFPVWWYAAPTIINTFMESYDFAGKTVVTFCTSGSSDIGKSDVSLKASCAPSVRWIPGKRFGSGETKASLAVWIKGLGL